MGLRPRFAAAGSNASCTLNQEYVDSEQAGGSSQSTIFFSSFPPPAGGRKVFRAGAASEDERADLHQAVRLSSRRGQEDPRVLQVRIAFLFVEGGLADAKYQMEC